MTGKICCMVAMEGRPCRHSQQKSSLLLVSHHFTVVERVGKVRGHHFYLKRLSSLEARLSEALLQCYVSSSRLLAQNVIYRYRVPTCPDCSIQNGPCMYLILRRDTPASSWLLHILLDHLAHRPGASIIAFRHLQLQGAG